MTWPEVIQSIVIAFIGALPATIAAFAALRSSNSNKLDIHRIEVATNSMKDQLVEATRKEARATGLADGANREQERMKEEAAATLLKSPPGRDGV